MIYKINKKKKNTGGLYNQQQTDDNLVYPYDVNSLYRHVKSNFNSPVGNFKIFNILLVMFVQTPNSKCMLMELMQVNKIRILQVYFMLRLFVVNTSFISIKWNNTTIYGTLTRYGWYHYTQLLNADKNMKYQQVISLMEMIYLVNALISFIK